MESMHLAFTKLHGLGNDYLYFDLRTIALMPDDWSQVASVFCDRHRGVGADGIITIHSSTSHVATMHIWNADGSRAEMCGNGLRGLVKWLYDRGIRDFSSGIKTDAGILFPEVLATEHQRATSIRIMMGSPDFSRIALGIDTSPEPFIEETLHVGQRQLTVSAVSMGNPHLFIMGKLWSTVRMAQLGPKLEQHPLFPQRINVHSMEIRSRQQIHLRHYERGAGQTLACGTGAAAAAALGWRLGLLDSPVAIHVPGGWLCAEKRLGSAAIYLTGPSEEVFSGEIEWPYHSLISANTT